MERLGENPWAGNNDPLLDFGFPHTTIHNLQGHGTYTKMELDASVFLRQGMAVLLFALASTIAANEMLQKKLSRKKMVNFRE